MKGDIRLRFDLVFLPSFVITVPARPPLYAESRREEAAVTRFFTIHRPWEDWLGMLSGLLIALSPWFAQEHDHRTAVANAFMIGVFVFFLAQLEYVVLQRWEEIAEAGLGIWLAISPYVFGYSLDGTLRYWHSSLGGIVILLAALKLWQDWELSDEDLASHGH
jgi:hypothetical protein